MGNQRINQERNDRRRRSSGSTPQQGNRDLAAKRRTSDVSGPSPKKTKTEDGNKSAPALPVFKGGETAVTLCGFKSSVTEQSIKDLIADVQSVEFYETDKSTKVAHVKFSDASVMKDNLQKLFDSSLWVNNSAETIIFSRALNARSVMSTISTVAGCCTCTPVGPKVVKKEAPKPKVEPPKPKEPLSLDAELAALAAERHFELNSKMVRVHNIPAGVLRQDIHGLSPDIEIVTPRVKMTSKNNNQGSYLLEFADEFVASINLETIRPKLQTLFANYKLEASLMNRPKDQLESMYAKDGCPFILQICQLPVRYKRTELESTFKNVRYISPVSTDLYGSIYVKFMSAADAKEAFMRPEVIIGGKKVTLLYCTNTSRIPLNNTNRNEDAPAGNRGPSNRPRVDANQNRQGLRQQQNPFMKKRKSFGQVQRTPGRPRESMKEAVCFVCNEAGHVGGRCPKIFGSGV